MRGVGKKVLTSVTDMAMAVLLPLLMAYSLVGEGAHEWMGVAMTGLFLLHHILNVRWYGALFSGRYSAVRVLNTVVNFLLLTDIWLTSASGIMMSSHVFPFELGSRGIFVARLIHLPCAYWGFLLMSFHIGLHWQAVLGRFGAVRRTGDPRKRRFFVRGLLILVSVYGAFAFFRRHFPEYLFLRTQFVFFDAGEALIFYELDMVAVMVLFAAIGYAAVCLLAKVTGQKPLVK